MRSPGPCLAALVTAVVLGAPAGCGYSLLRPGSGIAGVRTLAIAPLANETFEPGVEAVVLEALRKEAVQRGGLRLVEDLEQADLVLSGSVRRLSIQPRSFSSVVLSLEYEVTLSVELRGRRRDGGNVAIDPRALTETDTYLASADVEAMRKNRRETIHRLAMVVAARVFDSLYALGPAEPAPAPAPVPAAP